MPRCLPASTGLILAAVLAEPLVALRLAVAFFPLRAALRLVALVDCAPSTVEWLECTSAGDRAKAGRTIGHRRAALGSCD